MSAVVQGFGEELRGVLAGGGLAATWEWVEEELVRTAWIGHWISQKALEGPGDDWTGLF